MLLNELELKKLMKKDTGSLTLEEQISIDILNFIRVIHLNKQDFYTARFETEYFGALPMTFKKEAKCLIGHCQVNIKDENRVIDYLFTENGYELIGDVIKNY